MKAWQVTCLAGAVIFAAVMIDRLGGKAPAASVPAAMPEVAVRSEPAVAGRFPMPGFPDDRVSFEERWRHAGGPDVAEKPDVPAVTAAVPEPPAAPATAAEPAPVTPGVSGPVLASLEPAPATRDASSDVAPPAPAARAASSDAASTPPASCDTFTDAPRAGSATPDFRYLTCYIWSELPPAEKPAATVLKSFKDIPLGTTVEEIKRASDAFGLDANFMTAVAKIESGFDPKQRTGSYIGLFQLSKYEFGKFGSGDIYNPRDNAVAAAYKVLTEGVLFEWVTGRHPTLSDLYLIHQQGWEGAAEHINQPDRIAWKSMCATSEGREKGEKWCRRAIWGNTLPEIKKAWKSVENLTSDAFVGMWRERVAHFYSRYMGTATANAAAGQAK
jgi:hypothetical protein